MWKEKNNYKRKKLNFKKGQKWTFPKVLVHGFCPKIEFSLIAFFTEIMSEKIVFGYFKSETIVLRPENEV